MWKKLLKDLNELPPLAYNATLVIAALLSGLILKGIATLILKAYSKRSEDNYSFFQSLIVRLNNPLTLFIPLLILNLLLPAMRATVQQTKIADKTIGVLLIVVFAWLLIAIIKMAEDYVLHTLKIQKHNNLRERKIRTQLQFIRKVAILLIIVLSIGAILLSFNNLRRLGTGLLTGVGISGLIVGFAAQKSLGNLLAGFQIAFTQPIRIDDVLVVEGEWGKVEEINLTYVVVSIWDQRRLILPINYFLEKPFQNWTRNTSEILGTVFIYLDYNAPIEKLRQEFAKQLEQSKLWDKRVGVLQVTNASEKTIEVRALMSAENSSDAFDLRCIIREKLVAFITENYPDSLPKNRNMVNNGDPILTTTTSAAEKEREPLIPA